MLEESGPVHSNFSSKATLFVPLLYGVESKRAYAGVLKPVESHHPIELFVARMTVASKVDTRV